MKLIRIVLLPFSVLYAVVLRIRHLLFDLGWLASKQFERPVICVGNLSIGGTGKTPFTIYLARLLGDQNQLAILSRGYKRKTKGFVLADSNCTAETIGDEPMLIFTKLQNSRIAVDENRGHGIRKLIDEQHVHIIILDDGFQHRKVKPKLNILLTDYQYLYPRQWLLPSGPLRDIPSRARAADMIVVTKCPDDINFHHVENEIKPLSNQLLFYTRLNYQTVRPLMGTQIFGLDFLRGKGIVLFTGIAQPGYLENFLKTKTEVLKTVNFRDHHDYQEKDIQRITEIFNNFEASPKLVVTTEKDAVKLQKPTLAPLLLKLPIFVLTIEVEFLKDEEIFERELKKYVEEN